MPERILVTGGAGFIGSHLARRLLYAGHEVRVLDSLIAQVHGESRRPSYLDDDVELMVGDVRDPEAVTPPTGGSPVGARGRRGTAGPGLRATGVGETRPLDFCTPYGCSKGAADQYVLDWSRSFAVPTVVFRMSCIYGPISAAQRTRDGSPTSSSAFNIGGGPANAVSLLEVLEIIGEQCGRPPDVRSRDWRAGDQRYYVSDTSAFTRATGWAPQVDPAQGIGALYSWLTGDRSSASAAA